LDAPVSEGQVVEGVADGKTQGLLEEAYWSGKLLDCCPMLALFHPEKNRHPHTWRSWRSVLASEVQPWGRGPVKVGKGLESQRVAGGIRTRQTVGVGEELEHCDRAAVRNTTVTELNPMRLVVSDVWMLF
jgi:hypothetical protein